MLLILRDSAGGDDKGSLTNAGATTSTARFLGAQSSKQWFGCSVYIPFRSMHTATHAMSGSRLSFHEGDMARRLGMQASMALLRRARQRPHTVEVERVEQPTRLQQSVGARFRRRAAVALHSPSVAKKMRSHTGVGVEDVRMSKDLSSLTLRYSCFPGAEATVSSDLERKYESVDVY